MDVVKCVHFECLVKTICGRVETRVKGVVLG